MPLTSFLHSPQPRPKLAITYRAPNVGDLHALVRVEAEAFKDGSRRQVVTLNSQHGRTCAGTVAVHGGRVVGYEFHTPYPHGYRIEVIAVLDVYRRLGVGRGLIARLSDTLPCGNRDHLTALIHEHDAAALRFFLGCGFQGHSVGSWKVEDDCEGWWLVRRAAECDGR